MKKRFYMLQKKSGTHDWKLNRWIYDFLSQCELNDLLTNGWQYASGQSETVVQYNKNGIRIE